MNKLVFILLLLIPGILFAQNNFRVIGSVTDSTGNVLIGATTVVVSQTDSTLITFGITNGNGDFYLPNVPSGEHLLQITYVGYGSFQQVISDPQEGNVLDVGAVRLADDNVMLEEIVVKSQHIPVVINGDTIEYNAAAFKVRAGDAIEDLLKKLPGVEVLPSGEVQVQGETVTQIMVDGKEFFGNNPTMATRNLPADIVDKVAVFDDETDEAKFSGIDDGQDIKTINIKLKDDKKTGVFGKLTAGYGSANRYMGKANVNRFSPNMQATWIANLNNVNDLNFSEFDQGAMSGFNGIVIGGGGDTGPGITGDNRAISSGANLNIDFSKHFKLRSSYYYKDTRNHLLESIISENAFEDLSYISNADNDSKLKNSGHNLSTAFEFDIDSTAEIRWRNQLTLDDNIDLIGSSQFNTDINTNNILSSADQMNASTNKFGMVEGSLNYRKRLGKLGRTLRTELRYNLDQSMENWGVDNVVMNTDLSSRLRQLQLSDQHELDMTGLVYYTEPLSKRYFLNIGGGGTLNFGKFDKQFFNKTDDEEIIDDEISGFFNRKFNSLQIGSSIRHNAKKYGWSVGLGFQTLTLSNELNVEGDERARFNYVLPNIRYNKDIDGGGIRINYSTSVQEPGIKQLQNLLDNRNPFNTYIGNPDLIPSYGHRLYSSFNKYDAFSFRSFFGYLSATYSQNAIAYSRMISDNFVTQIKPINVDYNLQTLMSFTYGEPIPYTGLKLEVRTNGQYVNGITEINDVETSNQRYVGGLSLRLGNKDKSDFDLSIITGIDYTDSKYSSSESFNVNYFTTRLGLNFDVNFSDKVNFSTDYAANLYSQERFSTSNELHFLNANLQWKIGKTARWIIDVEVNDLFNAGQGIRRSANLGGVTETQSNQLGRYGMVKVSYSLSHFTPKRRGWF